MMACFPIMGASSQQIKSALRSTSASGSSHGRWLVECSPRAFPGILKRECAEVISKAAIPEEAVPMAILPSDRSWARIVLGGFKTSFRGFLLTLGPLDQHHGDL